MFVFPSRPNSVSSKRLESDVDSGTHVSSGYRDTPQGRTQAFVNNYSLSLPDINSMSKQELYNYYNSFSPLSSAYEFFNTAEYDISNEAKEDVVNIANSHQALIAQRLEQLTNEENSIAGQVAQNQAVGINSDIAGVSFTPSSVSSPSPSSVAKAEKLSPLDIVSYGMNLLSSGVGVASGVAGLAGSATSQVASKLALAGQVADISNKLLNVGIEDASTLGLSRSATKRLQKGINSVNSDQRRLIASKRCSDILNNMLGSVRASSDIDFMDSYNELRSIELAGQKAYAESLDYKAKAVAENSSNELKSKSNVFESEVIDSLDPSFQSQSQSLDLQGKLLDNQGKLLNNEGRSISNDLGHDNLSERSLFKVQREAFIKSIDARISSTKSKLSALDNSKLSEREKESRRATYQSILTLLESKKYEAYSVGSLLDIEESEYDNYRKFMPTWKKPFYGSFEAIGGIGNLFK